MINETKGRKFTSFATTCNTIVIYFPKLNHQLILKISKGNFLIFKIRLNF